MIYILFCLILSLKVWPNLLNFVGHPLLSDLRLAVSCSLKSPFKFEVVSTSDLKVVVTVSSKKRWSITSRKKMGETKSYNLFTRKPLALWQLGGMGRHVKTGHPTKKFWVRHWDCRGLYRLCWWLQSILIKALSLSMLVRSTSPYKPRKRKRSG